MAYRDDQVMLTLAGLAYRGFQDVLPGEPHEYVVRQAVLAGLGALNPVQGDWELVWGPVTSRVPLGVFDSNAMYVVRNARERHRYVVALRGTNPVSSSDWLFGDLWVGTKVRWPYATDDVAISTSTALGLAALQDMRARAPSAAARVAHASSAAVGGALDTLVRAGRARLSGITEVQAAHPSSLDAQVEKIVAHWVSSHARLDKVRDHLQQAKIRVNPSDLRRKLLAPGVRGTGLDLLTFLATEAAASGEPLEVIVTGHSKGGALAPTLALWLREALDSGDPEERWDPSGRARVRCHAFAAPTPGDAGFADRIDRVLGADHRHLRNANDIVTHAWQSDELAQIPALYGARSAPFARLLADVIAHVGPLNYRQARSGVSTFAGAIDSSRMFAAEFIYQHMDAYLAELGLLAEGISAVTFFI